MEELEGDRAGGGEVAAPAREGRADVEAIRKTYPNWTDEQLRNRAEWLHTCDDVAIEKSLEGLNEEDIHGDLPHLKMPTLLVQAGKGGVILEEDVADMKRLLPSLQVKKIPLSGHMLPFDDLPAFLEFWQANPAFGFLAVATRKGEIVDRRGLVSGGYHNPRKAAQSPGPCSGVEVTRATPPFDTSEKSSPTP